MLTCFSRKTSCVLVLLGLLWACKPTQSPVDPNPPVEPARPGVPTAVGKPLGTLVSKTIGPAGGTLTSADGTMTLRFPAGALTKETVITAQPVENTAFGGVGVGYEFGPHGTQFARPVTLSWTYQDKDLHGSSPEALGVAFQDDKNSWRGRTNLFVLADQHRVIAPIYHFSRYSFYENFWMEPMQKTLAPNETVELKVFYQENHERFETPGSEAGQTLPPTEEPRSPTDSTSMLGNDMITPLVPPVELLKADKVKNWQVNGQDVTGKSDSPVGFLSARGGKSLIYKAPAKAPENNPVAVSVEVALKGKGKLLLISQLTIESPNELYINGAKQDNAYSVADIVDGYAAIRMSVNPYEGGQRKQAGVLISIMDIRGPGTFTLSKANTGRFAMAGTDLSLTDYSGSYTPHPSGSTVYGPGSVTVSEFDVTNRIIAGSFTATLHYYNEARKEHKTMLVSVRFRTGGNG